MRDLTFAYYVRVQDGQIVEWPLYWDTVQERLNIYIPIGNVAGLPPEYQRVFEAERIPTYDKDFFDLVEVLPTKEEGIWVRTYEVRPKSLQDIDEIYTQARLKASTRVDAEHVVANQRYFLFCGSRIACDALAVQSIYRTNSQIQNLGDLPADWEGYWEAVDGTQVDISSKEDWIALFTAFYEQGVQNLRHARYLKQLIKQAADLASIRVVHWGINSPYSPTPLQG